MVSVIVRDNGERRVIDYTFEHLYSELKDIFGSELLIRSSWDVSDIKNRFVCFVEPDCLVSEGYFQKQLEIFTKLSPRVIMLSSTTAVKYWNNRIYGYYLDDTKVIPNRHPKGNQPYPIQVAYVPGTLIRTSSLKKLLKSLKLPESAPEDLIYYSSMISLKGWSNGVSFDEKHPDGQLGSQINLNPNVTYATTEEYVNDLSDFAEPLNENLVGLFEKESI